MAIEVVNNENGSIQIRGIYKNENSQLEDINLLNADDDGLDKTINSRSEEEPMLYNVIDKTETSKYENTLPIHRTIYDTANMEMYESYLEVMAVNPKAELVDIKTDCLVFNRIKKDIELSDDIGGVKIIGYQEVTHIFQTQNLQQELALMIWSMSNGITLKRLILTMGSKMVC